MVLIIYVQIWVVIMCTDLDKAGIGSEADSPGSGAQSNADSRASPAVSIGEGSKVDRLPLHAANHTQAEPASPAAGVADSSRVVDPPPPQPKHGGKRVATCGGPRQPRHERECIAGLHRGPMDRANR